MAKRVLTDGVISSSADNCADVKRYGTFSRSNSARRSSLAGRSARRDTSAACAGGEINTAVDSEWSTRGALLVSTTPLSNGLVRNVAIVLAGWYRYQDPVVWWVVFCPSFCHSTVTLFEGQGGPPTMSNGSPLGTSQKVMGFNPLAAGTGAANVVAAGSSKVGSLAGASLIADAPWAALLARLKGIEANEERLAVLEKEKVPYLFTSAQLMALMDLTLSVKTRIAMIQHVGPRLIDPRAKATQFVGMFRYSEEKEKVESVLKARTQAVMANKSLFRPQGLASTLGVADNNNNNHLPPPPQTQMQTQTQQKPSALANVQGARQPKAAAAAAAPRVPVDEMANLSMWREVASPSPKSVAQQPPAQNQPANVSTKMQTTSPAASSSSSSSKGSSSSGKGGGGSNSSSSSAAALAIVTQGLQEGWVPMVDPATNGTYYYCTATVRETTRRKTTTHPVVTLSQCDTLSFAGCKPMGPAAAARLAQQPGTEAAAAGRVDDDQRPGQRQRVLLQQAHGGEHVGHADGADAGTDSSVAGGGQVAAARNAIDVGDASGGIVPGLGVKGRAAVRLGRHGGRGLGHHVLLCAGNR
jgi:hypothetical protein